MSFGRPPNNTNLPLSFSCTSSGQAYFLELYVDTNSGIIPKILYISLKTKLLNLNKVWMVYTLD